jgi:hypothetical protein
MTGPWRAVGPLVLLTVCLSVAFRGLNKPTQTVEAAYALIAT